MKKKLLSLLLALAMCLSLSVPAFAVVPPEDAYVPEPDSLAGFDQYVIIMDGANAPAANAAIQTNGAVTKDISYGSSLSNAISYVESLNLTNLGYAHIEQACLTALHNYAEAGVELEYYAVLVPNGTAATEYTYGQYNGRTFYYTYTDIANFNVTKDGGSLDASSLRQWVEGAFHLIMSFANQVYSIGYSLFGSIGSNVTYSTGSSFEYIFQFRDVKSRTIYTYNGSIKKNVLVDQRGTSNLTALFVPIGAEPPSLTAVWNNKISSTTYYNNLNRNLQRAYVNYANNATERWYLSTELLSETWG